METIAQPKPEPRRKSATRAKAKASDTPEERASAPPSIPDILQACEHAQHLQAELLARLGLTLAQALRLLTTQRLIEHLSADSTPLRDTLQVKLMILREDKVEEAMRLSENTDLTEQDRISQIRAIFGR